MVFPNPHYSGNDRHQFNYQNYSIFPQMSMKITPLQASLALPANGT